jgi:hypothetical protein
LHGLGAAGDEQFQKSLGRGGVQGVISASPGKTVTRGESRGVPDDSFGVGQDGQLAGSFSGVATSEREAGDGRLLFLLASLEGRPHLIKLITSISPNTSKQIKHGVVVRRGWGEVFCGKVEAVLDLINI